MDGREFTLLVREAAIDTAVEDALKQLTSPRTPNPVSQSVDPIQTSVAEFLNKGAIEQQRRATWFQQLNVEQQSMLGEILRDCAQLGALGFCCVIDGVSGSYKGTFEIAAIDLDGKRTVLNPGNSKMLHDILSEVCAE